MKRVVLSTFHLMLVVKFSWTSFEVKLGLVYMILKNGWEMSYNEGGGGWARTILGTFRL